MVAYLLCAGFGTRMRPLTDETPKSLLPVDGRPMIDYLMDELEEWLALDAIHVVVNHRDAATFRAWARDWDGALDATLQVHDDGVTTPDEQLGAVGDLQFLLNRTALPSDGALVSGGDSLYRFPLAPLLNSFNGAGSQVLALHEPDPETLRQRSVLRLDGSRVTGLAEDPVDPPSHWICPSFYLLTTDALADVGPYLDAGGRPDALGPFVDWIAQSHHVEAVPLPKTKGLRFHCNTPGDLRQARTRLSNEPIRLLDANAVHQALTKSGP